MTDPRSTRPGRGLRARLIIGFGSAGALTALVTAVTAIVIGLAIDQYHPLWMSQLAHFVFGELPPHPSVLMIALALAVVAVIVLGIAVTVALLVARRVLEPIGQLAEGADRVASGDLDVRLEPEGHDELASLVNTFNAMTARVGESVQELRRLEVNARRFASDVSHELRSPLAAMTAVTEILEARATPMNAEEARATALVVEGIARLGRLVEDLMEISRFDAGTVVLDPETVRVADAVDACLQLRDWTRRVSVDVPEYLTVTADRRRLDVILANLIGNALRHGAPPFEIRAELVLEGLRGHLRVTVRDHGPGMSPEVLPAVFDRFYKAEVARSPSDGSGLGLAIALENARLHGGSITAANAPDTGAAFRLTLPLHAGDALTAPGSRTAPDGASTEASAGGGHRSRRVRDPRRLTPR